LPIVGGFFSKNKNAYSYLPESVQEFDTNVGTEKILGEVGFTKIDSYSLTLGIVKVVIATK
jgi:demethylmenaquinone methyltransferase/2-methoxy-6-polyprenyl-1,4-benzoquinol methylase